VQLEQYVEQQADNEIFVHFSKRYAPGCFYKFPGVGRDIYGFRGPETNRETFAQVLKEFGIAETRFVGAYFRLFRRILHYPRLVRWVFDAKMKRESFLPAS